MKLASGAVIVGFVLFGCSSNDSPLDRGTDAGTEGGTDAGVDVDVGVGVDAGDAEGGVPGGSFETAMPLQPTKGQAAATGTLSPPESASVYFKWTGKKGDRLRIQAPATPDHTPFTPGYVDTVLSIYDSQRKLVAENNDPVDLSSTDALLLTVLPADGVYYLRVLGCDAWERKTTCAPGPLTYTAFAVYLDTIENAIASLTDEHAEPNDTPANAATLTYTASAPAVAAGAFQQASDVDSFKASFPTQTVPNNRRAIGYFLAMPAGTTGNGSTAAAAPVTLQDSTGMIVLARYNPQSQRRMFAPISFATDYQLLVAGPPQPGANPFYFLQYGVTSRPYEANDVSNGIPATPEAITAEADGKTYFISGNSGAGDADYFKFGIPAGATKFSFYCYGVQEGSGVTIHARVLLTNVSAIGGGDVTESATAVAGAANIAVPGGQTSLLLGVDATSQDATVTSSNYDCEIFF